VLSIVFDNFLTSVNIFGILYSISVNSIIVGAMTILFISGGFDISVGAVHGFANVIVGLMMVKLGMPIPLAIFLTILIGATIGLFMGFIISFLNINPFFVTLAGYFAISSFMIIIAGRRSIGGFPEDFNLIASYKIANVPLIIIFSLISVLIFDILLRRNVFLRQNFAIGGNEPAAILAGVKVRTIKMFNYTMVSIMASIAGIFTASRSNSSSIIGVTENAFPIITAVIIGGASLKGGSGSVIGSFLGLIFVSVVYSSFIFLRLDIYWNKVALGLILIIVVLIDTRLRKEKNVRIR